MRAVSGRLIRVAIAAATLGSPVPSAAQTADDPFAKCAALFAARPDDYESAYCFYEVTLQRNLWQEGAHRFEALIEQHPRNFWLPLAYGHVYRSRDPARAETLYRSAAAGFQAASHAEGELLARSNLRTFLFPKGRVAEATREMERVKALGEASTDPLLKARAWTLEATHVQDAGGDLSHAYRLLKQTESRIFPNGPYRLKRSTLNSLGVVAFRLGRLDEALGIFTTLDRLAAAEGEGLAQANAQYNILNTSSLKESLLPTPGARERLMQLAERSLATATAAQNRDMTLKTHRALAELLAPDAGARDRALAHVDACLELSVKLRQPHDEAVCSWVRTSLLAATAPADAQAAELRALDATARANSPRTQAYSAARRMRLSWEHKPRADARRDAMAAIDAVETLRSLQDDAAGGAELFSTWTSDYYWLSGRLLESGDAAERVQAFAITERMRARALLDALERGRLRPDPEHPAVRTRRTLLESIAATQRVLMDPTLAAAARQTALQTLQDLELREQEARRQIALAFPAAPSAPSFATLDDIRATLGRDEALLSFQVALRETYDGEFGGGSWLIAVTRDRVQAYSLPDRAALAPIVPVFTGLLRRADGLDSAAAARLHAELLAPALRDLPDGITRLIVVPDGPLHQLPFDALRDGQQGSALGRRYQIVVSPSATLWRHWRSTPHTAASRQALAFADPRVDASAGNATERNAALERGLLSGRLPFARRESRALMHHLGDVEALSGARASERALKDRDLSGYAILHFAAHAIADEDHPERSAVLLAAGAATEDGLLQSREIQNLNLQGRVVVLSACQTASGAVLSGEGVMSLARAFFAAGAETVIGSHWPIRDEDAAWLFEAFYRSLAAGASLSEALQTAKTQAIDAGRPAAAWASLVLLGDGDFRPFPGGRPVTLPHPPLAPSGLLPLIVLALGVAVVARRWRHRTTPNR